MPYVVSLSVGNEPAVQKRLKLAVHKATVDQGDMSFVHEISRLLKEHPHMVSEVVKLIKARIKDKCTYTSLLALDLLGNLMRTYDQRFHSIAQQKLLRRISILAVPNIGTHPLVQRRAASLIAAWNDSYGSALGLEGFSETASQLTSKVQNRSALLVKSNSWSAPRPTVAPETVAVSRSLSCLDLSRLSKPKFIEIARLSQRTIMEQIHSSDDAATINTLFDQLTEHISNIRDR